MPSTHPILMITVAGGIIQKDDKILIAIGTEIITMG
jgi:hypothetical protein